MRQHPAWSRVSECGDPDVSQKGPPTDTAGFRLDAHRPGTALDPAASVQVVPVPWPGGTAVSLPAEPEPIPSALLLLKKQPEQAGSR